MNSLMRLEPLPDEIDRGYLGRLIRCNGLSHDKELFALLAANFGFDALSLKSVPAVELLALCAGQTCERFVQNHTTLPLRRAISSVLPGLRHGSLERRSLLVASGMRLAQQEAYFCEQCVRADIQFHGVSYWRREHQVPGQQWCAKHMDPLSYATDSRAYLEAPSALMAGAQKIPLKHVEEALANPYVLRTLDIAAGLMSHSFALDVEAISYLLRPLAEGRGLHRHGRAINKPLLSDTIKDCFPEAWLQVVYPDLIGKQDGVLFGRVDGVLYMSNSASSVWPYLMAAALLFPTADDALNAMIQACTEKARRNSDEVAAPVLADEELIAMYRKHQGSYQRLRHTLGVSVKVLRKRLETLGLPNLNSTRERVGFQAISDFLANKTTLQAVLDQSGLSLAEIGAMLQTMFNGHASVSARVNWFSDQIGVEARSDRGIPRASSAYELTPHLR